MRIDKYLWAVRIYKTRSKATDACRTGKVIISDIPAKASREVKKGEIIDVKKNPVTYRYRVIEPIGKRVSAKLAVKYVEDITPEEELKKLETMKNHFVKRDRGKGRPTKKERRDIERYFGW